MPPRGLDTFPVEIQTVILTEVVSTPCLNDNPSGHQELIFGLHCMDVCETWKVILQHLLPRLLPARAFIEMGLETFSFQAIGRDISKRKEMIAKAGGRGNMSDDAAREFDKLVHHLWTCLKFALLLGFMACIKEILDNVPEIPEIGESAYLLQMVANYKRPEVLKLLLNHAWVLKTIEKMNASGDTPLGKAVHGRSFENMEILMDYGASTNIRPSKDRQLRHYAYHADTLDGRLLTFATIKGDMKMLELLLRRGLKPEWEERTDEDTHLSVALYKNDLEMAQKLLDHGANVRFDPERRRGMPPLNTAIESCPLEMVKKLVDLGADYTGQYPTDALCTAITHNRQDVFTFLLERGAPLKPWHLEYAVGASLRIAAQILDIDGVEYAGPVFTSACLEGLEDFVRVFLDHGVDPNSRNISGTRNALENAVEAAATGIVKMLLNEGADVTGVSKGRLLSLAVLNGNREILKLLLEGSRCQRGESNSADSAGT